MTTHQDEDHIVTAEEPAWTEQRHRPGDRGTPEVVPDSLELYPLGINGIESKYTCTCGAELRSWKDVQDHFKEVVYNRDPQRSEAGAYQASLSTF